ncbi:hypothetical protein VIN01S_16360 [Vibrio inusitatus NBRC 102082]|uniref:Lipoprotein n=1 Tax=Vibrio inusitatus NBRC 102082 TaxID=1219070 RepID=A0A4Y3HVR0_9VIBR|nr:hypothetical protein [Vibrio inusitatus]GEA50832.1 hypothetical protein VIN01S_16360 [Vibrio inusitatus NBRC 102082]
MKYLILIPSLLLMLSACSSGNETNVEKQAFEDLRTEIRVAITDPEREKEVLMIIDELSEELQLLRDKKEQRQVQTRKLNANYDTTREEFEVFIKAKHADIRLSQQRILNKRDALIEATTHEEWDQIINKRSTSIDNAIKVVQLN